MRILFIITRHNGLSQRVWLELKFLENELEVHVATNAELMIKEVEKYSPDIIICPFLKTPIPKKIWKNYKCLIVHPGIKGDRGAYSLDWAIMRNKKEWGVTIIEAIDDMDAGSIWSSHTFPMRETTKSNLYRHEVTQAAEKGIMQAVQNFQNPFFKPEPLDYANPKIKGRWNAPVKRNDRKIDWNANSAEIIRKIRASDSTPGVLDSFYGESYFMFGACNEGKLRGSPKRIIARRHGAICIGTGNGAIWISHLKKKRGGIKLPATLALDNMLSTIPESNLDLLDDYENVPTFREISYVEVNNVGFLHFDFYNGAMCTDQCDRLANALKEIKQRDIRVIVLMGGYDIWSNGIHLNVIENSECAADESWNNINAINDLVREIIQTDKQYVISAMQGNAGAGGVMLALAADKVFARQGIVLNPHYKKLGLYGSEYWTYLLPRRVGQKNALKITEECLPISTKEAIKMGLIDDAFGEDVLTFTNNIKEIAYDFVADTSLGDLINEKNKTRKYDETKKSLEKYRAEELEKMYEIFYTPDSAYHVQRHHFVH